MLDLDVLRKALLFFDKILSYAEQWWDPTWNPLMQEKLTHVLTNQLSR